MKGQLFVLSLKGAAFDVIEPLHRRSVGGHGHWWRTPLMARTATYLGAYR